MSDVSEVTGADECAAAKYIGLRSKVSNFIVNRVPVSNIYVERRLKALNKIQGDFAGRTAASARALSDVDRKRKASSVDSLLEDVERYRKRVSGISATMHLVARKVEDLSRRAHVLRERVERGALRNEMMRKNEKHRDALLIAKPSTGVTDLRDGGRDSGHSIAGNEASSATSPIAAKVKSSRSRGRGGSKGKGKRKKKPREVELD